MARPAFNVEGWVEGRPETATFRGSDGDVYRQTTELSERSLRLVNVSSTGSTEVDVLRDSTNARPPGSNVEIRRLPGQPQVLSRGEFLELRFRDDSPPRKLLLPYPEAGVLEDVLPLCARRLAWPRLRLGQTFFARLLRTGGDRWERARLSLTQTRYTAETPAGSFRVHRFEVSFADGSTRTWSLGVDPPHPIVRVDSSGGSSAVLADYDPAAK